MYITLFKMLVQIHTLLPAEGILQAQARLLLQQAMNGYKVKVEEVDRNIILSKM
jgi:hypothetical protein